MSEKEPKRTSTVWGEEEIKVARLGFLRVHQTNQANLLLARLVNLGFIFLVCLLLFVIVRLSKNNGTLKPVVVRINDVGRAEAIRLDEDWVPEEKDLRDGIERLVERMYTRNGFETPRAIELNGLYLLGDGFDKWKKEALEDLPLVTKGENLRRVRILRCDIEKPSEAKTGAGTVAHVRFATDSMSITGAALPNTAQGWEVTMRIRAGDYPQNIKGNDAQQKKDQWVTRNPLGLRCLSYRLTRYIGEDVVDKNLEVVLKQVEQKVDAERRLEESTVKNPNISPTQAAWQ